MEGGLDGSRIGWKKGLDGRRDWMRGGIRWKEELDGRRDWIGGGI